MATVDTLISDARAFARSTTDAGVEALERMQADIDRIGFTSVVFNAPTMPQRPDLPDTLVPPVLDTISMELPAEPTDIPVFQDISPLDAGTAPVLTAVPPTLNLPSKPADLAAFTGQLPLLNTSFVFPAAPVLDAASITVPIIPDRAAPVAPTISLPVFDAQRPADLAAEPTDYAERFVAAYREAAPNMVAALEGHLDTVMTRFNPNYRAAMTSIEAQLARFLAGGTGFSAATENAIFERSRGKNNAEYLRTRQAALDDTARRGFTMPDGVLFSALQGSRQAAADNNAAGAREIVVLVAEQEQKNLQFAVTTSIGLRMSVLSASLGYHGQLVQINGQALDYAKNILGAIVQLYETTMKAYAARVDAYKADAVVYETRLKSALAEADLYEKEIRALEALTRVDHAKIDVYKARIDVLQSLAAIYRSQIDSIVAQASVEKLKVEVFQSQVQAFAATVNAKESEYRGYGAAINGEEAKMRIYSEEVRGYLAEVEGYRALIAAKGEVIRSAATTNEARSRQYSATLAGYTAVVNARGEKARTQLENQRQEIIAFQALAQAQESNARLQSDWYKSVSSVIIENAKLSVTTALSAARENLERSKAAAQLGTSSATVYGNFAASAMSGMNTLVSQQLTE